MKRMALFLSVLVAVAIMPILANAENSVQVYVNGVKMSFTEDPVMHEGTVYAPVGVATEAMSAKAVSKGSTITLNAAGHVLAVDTDKMTYAADGKSGKLDPPSIRIGTAVYLPFRFVVTQLGGKLTWDRLSSAAYVFTGTSGSTAGNPAYISDSRAEGLPAVSTVPDDEETASVPPDSDEIDSSGTPDKPAASANDLLDPDGKGTANQSLFTKGTDVRVSAIQSVADGIRVTGSAAMQPNAFKQGNPLRLVIDIPHALPAAKLNGQVPVQNATVPSSLAAVGQIRYALFSNNPNTLRIVIDLKQDVAYKIKQGDDNRSFTVALNESRYKVVVDAGHGGTDPGAESVTGRNEKDFTLSVAEKVNDLLRREPDIEPIMTRTDDHYITLDDRVAVANDADADLFVSIHGNIYENSESVRGLETYYWNDYSYDFAKLMHKIVLKESGYPDREVRQVPYKVIKYTDMPAILLELGYLSNRQDDREMFDEGFQNRLAQAIVTGIKQQLLNK